MLNLDDRMLRLQPWENVPPPIGVGGGDSSTVAKALAGRDTALHRPGRQAVHQLGTRPAASRPSLPWFLPSNAHSTSTSRHDWTSLGARWGRSHRQCWATHGIEIGCGVVVVGPVAVVIRPSTALRASTGTTWEEWGHVR